MKKLLFALIALIPIVAMAVEYGPAYSVMRAPSGGGRLSPGTIDLSQSACVGSSILSVPNGGIGAATLPSGSFLMGNGASAITTPSNFSWDNSNFRLGLGATPPLFEKKSANSYYIKKSDATQSYPIVVSVNPATNGLMFLRGGSSTVPSAGNCGTPMGEGYTCSRFAGGIYDITFSTAFADAPVCTASGVNGAASAAYGSTTTTVRINVFASSTGSSVDQVFTFICVGQRPT